MSRAHLVPPALAFLAGIVAGFHNVAFPALCAAVAAAVLLRRIARDVRLNVVTGVAAGVLEALFAMHAQEPRGDLRTTRFEATLIDSRSLDDERDAVTCGSRTAASRPPRCRSRCPRSERGS